MFDQQMTPDCPIGSLCLGEGRAQAQQGSPLSGPLVVREGCERKMGSCPMCLKKTRKTKKDDL